ncbi:MAG: hypothetical protein ABJN52_00120 [Litorimonas sp.]
MENSRPIADVGLQSTLKRLIALISRLGHMVAMPYTEALSTFSAILNPYFEDDQVYG